MISPRRLRLRLPAPRGIAARLILTLSMLACLPTTLSLILHDTLSGDLEAAARVRLDEAADAAETLLANYLADTLARWQALSRTPEFRANLEVADRSTLRYFAGELRSAEGAAVVAFRDRSENPLAVAGEPALAVAARDTLARLGAELADATESPSCVRARDERAGKRARRLEFEPCAARDEEPFATLLGHGGGYVLVRIPLSTRGRSLGVLLVVERVPSELLADWSGVIGAQLTLESSEEARDEITADVLRIPGLIARVHTSNHSERQALANSRRHVLVAGLFALAVGFQMAMWLGSTLARPIQELRDATVRAGSGDLDVRVDATRRDELGDVARAFNTTLDNLRQSRDRLVHLAYTDLLTGIGNRRSLQEELDRRLAETGHSSPALMIVDLSRFKAVNDTLGTLAGDAVLKEAAERIGAAVAEFAGKLSVGPWRLGGNEFAILLATHDAESAAQRILTQFEHPFDVAGHGLLIGVRIGIALEIASCASASAAICSCDLALRQAKRHSSNHWVVYDSSMDEPVLRRHTLEQRLRAAVETDSLRIVYQPRVAAKSGRIVAFEALVRWTDSVFGVVSPDEFIRLAEETRIVIALGERVLRHALAQAAIWHRSWPSAPVRISVNVSQIQLSSSFVELVKTTLAESALPPASLELEITETALMEDEGSARDALQQLRAFGVRIALDDFGSGYSSLGMLRQLPIGVLKMDRALVRGLGEDDDAEAVAAAIVALARVYSLEVVAEGVETPEQRELLVGLGCDELQGLLFSPPLDTQDATSALERGLLDGRKARPGTSHA